jgi:NAD(P)-dependent dehydrogenase (short-subunit alcohol dehydrogenase family)
MDTTETRTSDPHAGPRLAGKVAIITGASRGIGEAVAEAFAAAGARLVLAARDQRALDALAARLREAGAEAVAVATDVSDPASVARLHAQADDAFGRLDVAFNNAAGGGHRPMPLADVAVEDFDAAYAVNLRGTFCCLKQQIPRMVRSGGGAIVNMSSTAGVAALEGLAAYATTKRGIIALTRVAALDYAAQGVRVNAIAPGTIDTYKLARIPAEKRDWMRARIPMGRLGTPAEVADVVVWLCSDHASYVTGATITADGGRLAGGA